MFEAGVSSTGEDHVCASWGGGVGEEGGERGRGRGVGRGVRKMKVRKKEKEKKESKEKEEEKEKKEKEKKENLIDEVPSASGIEEYQ